MIFVTVGTQLPFDRLIEVVDKWAGDNAREEVFAQIGPSVIKPRHISYRDFLAPSEANVLFARAELIVSHAGMGSILTAMKYRKPILVMARRASLGEHRNEHQLATVKWLSDRPGITVAWEAKDVGHLLDARDRITAGEGISESASEQLIVSLRNFICA